MRIKRIKKFLKDNIKYFGFSFDLIEIYLSLFQINIQLLNFGVSFFFNEYYFNLLSFQNRRSLLGIKYMAVSIGQYEGTLCILFFNYRFYHHEYENNCTKHIFTLPFYSFIITEKYN